MSERFWTCSACGSAELVAIDAKRCPGCGKAIESPAMTYEIRERARELADKLFCKEDECWISPEHIANVIYPELASILERARAAERCLLQVQNAAIDLEKQLAEARAQAPEIERLEAEIAEVQRQLRGMCSMFCESHLETTLSDANVNDPCKLCEARQAAFKEAAGIAENENGGQQWEYPPKGFTPAQMCEVNASIVAQGKDIVDAIRAAAIERAGEDKK